MKLIDNRFCARHLMVMFFMTLLSVCAYGQNLNDNNLSSTPYSRYGYGRMGSVGNAATKSMGDVSTGMRLQNMTNLANPASLTAIDTLSMVFSVGLDAQMGYYSEGNLSERKWDGGLSYMSFQFQTWANQAMSISLTPYSMVGYNFGSSDKESLGYSAITNNHVDTLRSTQSFYGVGGVNNFMLGYAWNVIHNKKINLSIGANVGYLWGTTRNTSYWSVNSGQANSTYVEYTTDVKGMNLKFGMQYSQLINADHEFTLGATFQPKINLNVDAEKWTVGTAIDTLIVSSKLRSRIYTPMSYAVGASYRWQRQLTVGFDYEFTKWSDAGFADVGGDGVTYNNLRDVHEFRVGAEYIPRLYGRSYFQACRYRLGFNTKNGYAKIPTSGANGTTINNTLREYNATIGIGMPVNKRCLIDIGVGYQRIQPSADNMLKENYLKIVVGLTFNEMMFFRNRLR